MLGELWNILNPDAGGYCLAFLGIGLPFIGGALKAVGTGLGLIKGEKRKDVQEGFSREELALQRERFEEDKRKAGIGEKRTGAFFDQAKARFLDRPEPGKEDLSGLFASNPFVGGRQPLGASARGAGTSLGFEGGGIPTGGPIQAPAPAPGPGRGEALPVGPPGRTHEGSGRPINVGDNALEQLQHHNILSGEALEPGKAHRGTVETQKRLLDLFGGTGPAAQTMRKGSERRGEFRLPSIRGERFGGRAR